VLGLLCYTNTNASHLIARNLSPIISQNVWPPSLHNTRGGHLRVSSACAARAL